MTLERNCSILTHVGSRTLSPKLTAHEAVYWTNKIAQLGGSSVLQGPQKQLVDAYMQSLALEKIVESPVVRMSKPKRSMRINTASLDFNIWCISDYTDSRVSMWVGKRYEDGTMSDGYHMGFVLDGEASARAAWLNHHEIQDVGEFDDTIHLILEHPDDHS